MEEPKTRETLLSNIPDVDVDGNDNFAFIFSVTLNVAIYILSSHFYIIYYT